MTLQESDVNGAGDLNGDFTSKPDDEPSTPFLSAPSEEYKKLHKEHGTDDLDLDSADLDSDDLDTRCGFWLCQPSFLQPCARITTFTGFYSLAGLITSTLNVYVNSQITTLERQFGFSSTQTGIIMAANDVGFLVCVLFLSYSASTFHIPRSLGIATSIFGLSGIACCLPFFLFRSSIDDMVASFSAAGNDNLTSASSGQAKSAGMFGDLCVPNKTADLSPESTEGALEAATDQVRGLPSHVVTASLAMIFVGMMLQGFGKSPRYAFTVTYIDSNTGKTNTGFYMGIIIACAIFGPTLAYALGGIFSRMFVTLEETTLTPQHPRWIGAWWLGYIVCGMVALLAAVPLMFFPRRLPQKRRRHDNTEDNPTQAVDEEKQSGPVSTLSVIKPAKSNQKPDLDKNETSTNNFLYHARHIKLFLSCMGRLFTNPIYLSLVTSSCFDIFSVSGLSAYTPKYIERMFDMPTYKANYILSANVLCAACMGTFIGGYLSRRLKMTAVPALLFALLVESIAMGGNALALVFSCDQPEVHNWPESGETCSDGCSCEDNSFFAVCGSDGKTYYSPCTAGCQEIEAGVYQNCTCIPGQSEAFGGMCPYGCGHIYTYFVAISTRGLFGTLSIIPKLVVMIRCVLPKDKGLAIGFSAFMTSLLGWLLGPIIFGSVIDGICTIWDVTSAGVRGRCLLYDNDVFKMKLHGYSSLSLLFSNAALLFGYLYARCTGCLDDPPTDDLAKCGDQGQSQGQGQGLNKDQYQKEQAEINGESLKKSVDYSKGDANSDVEIVKEKPESI